MKELIIDTATNLLYVGLINDGKHDYITRKGHNDNAAFIVNYVDQILKRNNLTLTDINNIIVGIGPGSYTGLRASLAVAKMFAYTKAIPLKTISSLLLLSSGYKNEVTVAIDARRKHYFAATYNNGLTVNTDAYVKGDNLGEFLLLNDETINVDLNIVSTKARVETDIFNLVPNYLRITEAERNNDQKSNN